MKVPPTVNSKGKVLSLSRLKAASDVMVMKKLVNFSLFVDYLSVFSACRAIMKYGSVTTAWRFSLTIVERKYRLAIE